MSMATISAMGGGMIVAKNNVSESSLKPMMEKVSAPAKEIAPAKDQMPTNWAITVEVAANG